MKKLAILIVLLNYFNQSQVFAQVKSQYSVIPQPLNVKTSAGKFPVTAKTLIYIDGANAELNAIANKLIVTVKNSTGYQLSISKAAVSPKNAIVLSLKKAPDSLGKEGYILTSTSEKVTISALEPQGLFYGVQTLSQLLPASKPASGGVFIPALQIIDKPRFAWRGVLLDVGRYFYPVDEIKKTIDYLAMHKMNTFHWHLTEDQGWRIQIDKYPKLTEISSQRKGTIIGHHRTKPRQYDNKPHGGFYTKDQIREVVRYAQERYITVVPEIEMPGHSVAALAAYPELSCTGGPFEVSQTWGVHEDVYCAGNEQTFKFLEDVLSEVVALFPGKIIHIGGDEVPKKRWKECPKCQQRIKELGLKDEHELQSYFITRMEKYLQTKNKSIIGWDEILEGGLAPNATVMSWRGVKGGIAAAKQKHDVIMTPDKPFYLDHYQGERALEPLAIGGLNTLSQVYAYEPASSELTSDEVKYIKGAQANVWTEYIPTFSHAEYMIFPRLAAVSEVVWAAPQRKDWKDFSRRMQNQYERYDVMGINYSKSAYNVWYTVTADTATKKTLITLNADSYLPEIRYTTDGTEPTYLSAKYERPLEINGPLTLKAANFKGQQRLSKISEHAVAQPKE